MKSSSLDPKSNLRARVIITSKQNSAYGLTRTKIMHDFYRALFFRLIFELYFARRAPDLPTCQLPDSSRGKSI